jgi:hypothetical protein
MKPTIKGAFVNSHIQALRNQNGEEAVKELQRLFGKSLVFRPEDDIPIVDEVAILEHIVVMRGDSPDEVTRRYEAGQLHFKNFTTTYLWRIIGPLVEANVNILLLNTKHFANFVFRNVTFNSEALNARAVKVRMTAIDYPIEHFEGFFDALLARAKLSGHVESIELPTGYEYVIRWSEPHISVHQ